MFFFFSYQDSRAQIDEEVKEFEKSCLNHFKCVGTEIEGGDMRQM